MTQLIPYFATLVSIIFAIAFILFLREVNKN